MSVRPLQGEAVVATTARQVVASVSQLATSLYLARLLGATGYGEYSLAVLAPSILVSLLALGLPSATAYFLAQDTTRFRSVMAVQGFNLLLACFLLLAFVIGAFPLVMTALLPDIPQAVMLISIVSTLVALAAGQLLSVLQGLQMFRTFNIASLSGPVANLMVVATLAWWPADVLVTAVLGWTIGHASILMVAAIGLLPVWRRTRGDGIDLSLVGPMYRYGLQAQVSILLSHLSYRLDFYLVNAIAGAAAVGVFGLAKQLVEKTWLVSHAALAVLLPRLAEQFSSGNRSLDSVVGLARGTLYSTLALALALVASLLVIGEYVIPDDVTSLIVCTIILVPGVISFGVTRVLGAVWSATGRVYVNTFISLFHLLASGVLCVVLTSTYGLTGAAIAAGGAYLATSLLALFLLVRKFGLSIRPIVRLRAADLAAIRKSIHERMPTSGKV